MTTQITEQNQLIGKGLHDDFPAICIQDYETNRFVWSNVYEIFQNSNDLEEFQEHMTKARKSICIQGREKKMKQDKKGENILV